MWIIYYLPTSARHKIAVTLATALSIGKFPQHLWVIIICTAKNRSFFHQFWRNTPAEYGYVGLTNQP